MADTPIIDFKPGRFFSRIFVVLGEGKDFMGCLYKDPGGPWRLTYRFRYYHAGSRDPFDGQDEKSVVDIEVPPEKTKQEMIKITREMLSHALEYGFGGDGQIHELVLETSDTRQIMRQMEREKFFHFKRITPEEARRRGLMK